MLNMFMFIIILLLVLMVFYVETRFLKFGFIKKINNKLLMYLITLIPFVLILVLFNYVNAVIIIFHLFIFFVIYGLIFFIIKKLFNKKSKHYLVGYFAIFTTIIYLSIGAYLDYHIWETKYTLTTNKNISENIRILQITDTHVGTTFDGDGLSSHFDKMKNIKPDIVVITGDFVDDDTTKEDMIKSVKALNKFETKYGIYFIYGNHDKGYFNYRNFTDSELRSELMNNNITILEDQTMLINDNFYLIGRKDKTMQRLSIEELTKDLDKSKYIIDLNHQPNDFENEKNAEVDLVLSGHTHGGQLFPLGYIGLLTKANDEFKGLHKRGNTTLIINTGMSDWAIDFKTGTKSEYTIIDIMKENNNE